MALGEIVTAALCSVFGSWSSILLFIVVLLATWMYYKNPARHAAPGPTYIPLIGNLPFLFGTGNNGKYFMEMSEKYRSPIVSERGFGCLRTTLNDYDLIKEVFIRRSDTVDRPTNVDALMASLENFQRPTSGLDFGSGRIWNEQRRFTLRMMKDFGMGNLSGEENIHFEASETIKAFKLHNGQPFNPHRIVMMAISNIVNQFIMGKRFHYDDERFINTLNNLVKFMILLGDPVTFAFPSRFGRWLFKSKFESMREGYMVFVNHVKEEIKEHKARFDGSIHDMIDAYLVEMETTKDKEFCNENELLNLIRDIFLAGSDTSANVLRWALLEMAIHQDIQEKVYQELSTVIGPGSVPSMMRKNDTPYTEAVVCEIQRFHTLAELGVPRSNIANDIEICGYTIPKNTIISPNLYAVHHDRKFWKKPDEFYPENFLDEEGKVTNQERLIPYSIGRRSCACEPLARAEIYIFFATWLKTFHVKLEADDTVPDISCKGFTVMMPEPFSLRLDLRTDLRTISDIHMQF